MKKFTHKLAALGLSLVLSAGLLSGCGESYDPIQEAFGIPGSTVMMTVDEKEVHASDLYYWLAYNADYIKQYYSIMGGEEGAINWDDTLGGTQSVKDYVKEEAKQTAVLYNAVLSNTAAAGYAFDSDDPQYTKELEAAKSNLGGEEAFARFLKEMCLTEDSFETLNSVAVVYDHMRQGLYRSGGEFEPTKEELDQFIQDKDLLAARHILLMTKDPATGEDLAEDAVAQKKAKAEELLGQLQGIEDSAQRSETFSKLMKENSEDSGLESFPNGYLFTAGDMVPEFEQATRDLEIGAVSGIVESDYGYHIILRDDPAQSDELLEQWSTTKMESLTEEWVSSAKVETTEAFDNLDIAAFYEQLEAFRASLAEADQAQDGEEDAQGEDAQGEDAQGEGTQGEDQQTEQQDEDTKEDTKEDAKDTEGEEKPTEE